MHHLSEAASSLLIQVVGRFVRACPCPCPIDAYKYNTVMCYVLTHCSAFFQDNMTNETDSESPVQSCSEAVDAWCQSDPSASCMNCASEIQWTFKW